MKLTLGFSPCPNDTFIFDALVNKRIDTEGIELEVTIADVEELNKKAFGGELDVTKLSFHTLAYVLDQYKLLYSGCALGMGNGPILIGNRQLDLEKMNQYKVAIPGKYTTANFLFSLAFPDFRNKYEYLFSDIIDAIKSQQVDAGLIIHETRFTYQDYGLNMILDLGAYWEQLTNLPLPLGGIVVHNDLPIAIKEQVNQLIKKSIQYALANPDASRDYIEQYASELDREVVQQHIPLYVNDYTVDLGEIGQEAVRAMFDLGQEKDVFTIPNTAYFFNS